jgi:phospholipase A1/A2
METPCPTNPSSSPTAASNLLQTFKHYCLAILLLIQCTSLSAQEVAFSSTPNESPYKTKTKILSRDSINAIIKSKPSFSIFQDNYFLTGIPLDRAVNEQTADAKFQISFRQRLTNAVLPFQTFLYLTYTQKSFWDIYKSSSPFAESNYNPSLGLFKFIRLKNRLASTSLTWEHESNGRDSIFSRSWNFFNASFTFPLKKNFFLDASARLPYDYKGDNPDLPKFVGAFSVGVHWKSPSNSLFFDLMMRRGRERGSLQGQLGLRPFKSENQYIGIQWFTGYAESLINFSERVNMIRIGMMIRPPRLEVY